MVIGEVRSLELGAQLPVRKNTVNESEISSLHDEMKKSYTDMNLDRTVASTQQARYLGQRQRLGRCRLLELSSTRRDARRKPTSDSNHSQMRPQLLVRKTELASAENGPPRSSSRVLMM